MIEIYRVCTKEPNHRFATDNGEGYWMGVNDCPYCKRPLKTLEIQCKDYKTKKGGIRDIDSMGFFRSEFIDNQPRMQWFDEAIEINDEDQKRSGETWYVKEAIQLTKMYEEHGDSIADTWKEIAETSFKRSLLAIERQLRAIKACIDGEKRLEELYPL